MCGADGSDWVEWASKHGSPPRVRSRPQEVPQAGAARGITSACAEQTQAANIVASVSGDHLRVCGADSLVVMLIGAIAGSPPRVRSRHRDHVVNDAVVGITSACAEQTSVTTYQPQLSWDHLRVCGADWR